PDLLVDRADQHQGLRIRQSFAVLRPAAPPSPKAALAHRQGIAQDRQREGSALRFDPGIFHSRSFAKYAAAFFVISSSISSRATWARNRDSSICSAVICLAPAGFSLPA